MKDMHYGVRFKLGCLLQRECTEDIPSPWAGHCSVSNMTSRQFSRMKIFAWGPSGLHLRFKQNYKWDIKYKDYTTIVTFWGLTYITEGFRVQGSAEIFTIVQTWTCSYLHTKLLVKCPSYPHQDIYKSTLTYTTKCIIRR